MRALIFILFCGFSLLATAQQDSAIVDAPPAARNSHPDTVRKHSPKTATLLSLVLPGAGQVYNRKNWWWKVPVIYGGGAALVYGVSFYQKNYVAFRDAYAFRVENNVTQNGNPRFDRFENANLQSIRDSYRDSRDQCIIGLAVLYALQVVDATVEAHFFDFNVSEDLSLNIQPQFVTNGFMSYNGVQLTLRLRDNSQTQLKKLTR